MQISNSRLQRFKNTIWIFYTKHKRDFPWRQTTDPYHILVSEFMLQQTQVSRVQKKYTEFIHRFPTIHLLAASNMKDVHTVWQGMGYNRRALYLRETARNIVKIYKGVVPADIALLDALPGIGKATAGSICAYAYNLPVSFIETNIRRVYIHFFFSKQKKVTDTEIFPLVKKTVDTGKPREWYWALMDYGTYLSQIVPNPNRKSAEYVKQSQFHGSTRQLRGEVMRLLIAHQSLNLEEIVKKVTTKTTVNTSEVIEKMIDEGLLEKNKGTKQISIAS